MRDNLRQYRAIREALTQGYPGEQGQELVAPGAQVAVLGDGACDGIGLQHTLQEAGWSYGCHTGSDVTASWDGETFRLDTVGWCIKPRTLVSCPEASVT